jgi:hypothetical protein
MDKTQLALTEGQKSHAPAPRQHSTSNTQRRRKRRRHHEAHQGHEEEKDLIRKSRNGRKGTPEWCKVGRALRARLLAQGGGKEKNPPSEPRAPCSSVCLSSISLSSLLSWFFFPTSTRLASRHRYNRDHANSPQHRSAVTYYLAAQAFPSWPHTPRRLRPQLTPAPRM